MGKKAKEKRNHDVVVQASKSKSETKSESRKPENDLYSQIFADTTDDDEPITKEKAHSQNPNTTGRKKETSQSKSQQGKPVQNMKLKLSETSAEAVHKNASLKTVISKDTKGSNMVTRNLKQAESESSESEEDEVVYDDDDEEDNMDLDEDEDKDEGNESESNEPDDEEDEQSDVEDELEDGTTKTPLRNQLKDLSFIELEALKQKMGLKEYNEAMFGNKDSKKQSKKKRFERKNKNRPLEVSSKRRVPKFREIVKVPKKVQKDPRFDNACGEYSETFWNTEYNFLRDLQKTEAEHLRKNLKTVDDNEKKREIRKFIQKVSDKEKAIVVKEKEAQIRLQHKEENKKRVEEGKRPFYVKKSTQKFLELVEKYDELKSSGGLEKYLKKKRKKNAVRDRKSLKPFK